MQGLADGYFVIPYTIGHYRDRYQGRVTTEHHGLRRGRG